MLKEIKQLGITAHTCNSSAGGRGQEENKPRSSWLVSSRWRETTLSHKNNFFIDHLHQAWMRQVLSGHSRVREGLMGSQPLLFNLQATDGLLGRRSYCLQLWNYWRTTSLSRWPWANPEGHRQNQKERWGKEIGSEVEVWGGARGI